tara:strand:- start:1138 stop:2262 length:1125 start_codon:yes stop_codon:yes gene_type:complete
MINRSFFISLIFFLATFKLPLLVIFDQSQLVITILISTLLFFLYFVNLTKFGHKLSLPNLLLLLLFISFTFRFFFGYLDITSIPVVISETSSFVVLYAAICISQQKYSSILKQSSTFFNLSFIFFIITIAYLILLDKPWENPHGRLEVADLGPGVIASWSFGILILAFMSMSKKKILIGFIICFIIAFLTEMRTVGLPALFGLFLYILFWIKKSLSSQASIFSALILTLLVLFFFIKFGTTIFMFEDTNRGLNNGFSGRLQSWIWAFQAFENNPILGIGQTDWRVTHCYNGYIRVFAKFGFVVGIYFLYLFALAIFRSIKQKEENIFISLIMFAIYFLPISKDFDLEIMPFLGFILIFISLKGSKINASRPLYN